MSFAAAFPLAPDSEDDDFICVIILFVTAMVFNFTTTSWTAEVEEIAQSYKTMVFCFQDIMNNYMICLWFGLGLFGRVVANK